MYVVGFQGGVFLNVIHDASLNDVEEEQDDEGGWSMKSRKNVSSHDWCLQIIPNYFR